MPGGFGGWICIIKTTYNIEKNIDGKLKPVESRFVSI